MPEAVARLPRDRRGLPIPFIALDAVGLDLLVADPVKRIHAIKHRLCGICGQRLLGLIFFVGGSASVENHLFADPGMHEECARYSASVFPFPCDGLADDDMQIIERPREVAFYITRGYQEAHIEGDPMLYVLADSPEWIEWLW